MKLDGEGNIKVLWNVIGEAMPDPILDTLSILHWNAIFAEDERRQRLKLQVIDGRRTR